MRLDPAAVIAQEKARIAATGDFETPGWVCRPLDALCWVLDIVYDGKPIQK
jgi:hypothetical protein